MNGNPKIIDGIPSKKHTEYKCWEMMRNRCRNKNADQYAHYGNRGITVCEEWNSFEIFLRDVGKRPSPKHSLERIDNNGNYEPGNVIWATTKQQQNNTRRSAIVEICGETKTKQQWCDLWEKKTGIPALILRKRVFDRGNSLEKAFGFPYRKKPTKNREQT